MTTMAMNSTRAYVACALGLRFRRGRDKKRAADFAARTLAGAAAGEILRGKASQPERFANAPKSHVETIGAFAKGCQRNTLKLLAGFRPDQEEQAGGAQN
jgi:hypothetical protein